MLGGNAYLLLGLGSIWFVCFEFFRDLRREQFIASLMAGALFPIIHAYTHPSALIFGALEHLVFLFVAGGLSSISFHILFGQYYLRTPRHLAPTRPSQQSWAWRWIALAFSGMWIMVLLGFVWPALSGGWILFLTGILFLLYYSIARQDLLFDAVMSAFLMISLFAMVDIVLSGSPTDLELYLQAAGLGLFFGPLYEFARNLRLHHVNS